ncbi:MAG: hypothetical protein WBL88_07675 [Nitrososphaeraceae archaeon]
MTFKDLKKRVTLEATQHRSKLSERLLTNHFGYGILNSINKKTLELMTIAASITLFVYHREMAMINLSMIISK